MNTIDTNKLIKHIKLELSINSDLIKLNGISTHRYALLQGRLDAYAQLISWLKDNCQAQTDRGKKGRKSKD